MTTGDPMSSFCGGAATAGDIEEATSATAHPNSMPIFQGRCRCFIGVLTSHRSVTGREVPGNRTFDLGSGRPRWGHMVSQALPFIGYAHSPGPVTVPGIRAHGSLRDRSTLGRTPRTLSP